MAIIGAAIGKLAFGDDAFGRKPVIPQLPDINPGQVQQQTISGNLAALPQASRLASAINLFGRQELEKTAPGAGDVLKTGTKQLQSFLRGELPQDVSNQVQQRSAESAVAGGFGGSGAARSLEARDLGLTSLNLIQQGLSSADRWLASAQQLGGAFDVSSLMFSPQQRLAFEFDDRSQQFQRGLIDAQVKAAPDPWAAAFTQAMIQDEAAIMEMVGNVIGIAGGAAGACWVARAVFGTRSINWRLFRIWLVKQSPRWFLELYLREGPAMAEQVRRNPVLRNRLEILMNPIVNRMAEHYGVLN